ncbi:EAL domain-containing protein [Hydrogenothermus marinus]|uniref:PAS domain S-box-containing protein/diguanylate cyclase (GGDEF)-like protein n=1 Tax=Hydrogenothermus marinus TaxID=133270 RepID=A0A3M0BEX0_9AQUI|nr:EAL domain-containing protein [Hydrogenothermus marinus]RMA93125.1 PAS domain S-box-containing protein/diguanylate cyclase (GGDEF)-like protein [Hydrogenothermus marinus]
MDRLIKPAESFFRKLKFKHKILVMFLIGGLIPYLIFSYPIYKNFYEELTIIQKEKKALKVSSKIFDLLKLFQEHRGLMYRYLKGEKSLKKDILIKEKNIDKLFSDLENYKHIINITFLKREWLKIKSIKNTKQNFLAHTKLIKTIINLLENLAINYDLYVHRGKNIVEDNILVALFDTIPNINETIREISVYLTEFLSEKNINPEDKRIIQNLISVLKFNLQKLDLSFKYYFKQDKNNTLKNEYKSIKKDIENYINYVQNIINQKEYEEPEKFFEDSRKIISKIDSFRKNLLQKINVSIQERENELYTEIYLLIFGLIALLLIVSYLSTGFYYSIEKPLVKIERAIQRLRNQDYTEYLTINTEDEFKKIAETFNIMQDEIKKYISFLKGYQIALDSATLVSKSDIKGNITYANKAFLEITGYKLEEVLGKPHNIFRHPDEPKEKFEDMWKTILSKKVWKGILKIKTKDGRTLVMKMSIVPILDEKGNIEEFVAVRVDITDLIEAQEKLRRMLYFDNLTSLPNRTKLIEDIRKKQPYAIVIFNIDDFRELNDIYGFEAGNYILKEMSKILKGFEKEYIKLYKFPSDEFTFVFFSKKDKNEIKDFVLSIIFNIENRAFNYEGFDINILLRAGIALINGNYEVIEKAILDTEAAVKKVKETNFKYLFYDESKSAKQEYVNTLKWISKIKNAIANDRIVPYFQPIYNNKTKKIEKYEALVRLIDEDGKVVSPYYFLDIAKRAKLYPQITKIMIEKSLKVFENREEEISLNISTLDLLDSEIYKFIKNKIKEYNIKSSNSVVLEITESEEIESYNLVADFIKDIKEYNVKISIDDFGTGYSNFVYILNIGVDYLKIDGSLIKNILTDDKSLTLVKAIVHFTKELGIKTIAEFVSDENIQRKIEEIGIDYSQGYYIREPIPAEKLPLIDNKNLEE